MGCACYAEGFTASATSTKDVSILHLPKTVCRIGHPRTYLFSLWAHPLCDSGRTVLSRVVIVGRYLDAEEKSYLRLAADVLGPTMFRFLMSSTRLI